MDTVKHEVNLHVFYGIACTGKSTSAVHFAHEHSIRTIIPTDYVREVQRACARPLDGPLMKVTHNAWELVGELSSESIVKGFILHVDAVVPALVAIVHKLSKDGFDAIIEGVHCYSHVLDQFQQVGGLIVLPRLLMVTSESQLLEHVQHKEQERSCSGEPKDWKKHIPTLMKIQDFLLQDAAQRNIPIICTDEGGRNDAQRQASL